MLNPSITIARGSSLSPPKLEGYTAAQTNLNLSYSAAVVQISGSANGAHRTGDANYNDFTAALTRTDAKISIGTPGALAVGYTSLNTALATVDQFGYVTSQLSTGQSGHVVIVASWRYGSQKITIPVSQQGGQVSEQFAGYSSGTLARGINDRMNALLSGLTASTDNQRIFTTYDGEVNPWIIIRNPGIWTSKNGGAVDLTPLVAYTSEASGKYGGFLIAPRFIGCATHATLGPGTQVVFVNNSNQQFKYIIVGTAGVPNTNGIYNDVQISILDRDVDSSIGVLPLFPSTVLPHYFATISTVYPDSDPIAQCVPYVWQDQFQNLWVGGVYAAYALADGGNATSSVNPSDAQQLTFAKPGQPITGDSGHACCMIIGNQLVLVSHVYGGTPPAGAWWSSYITSINTLMSSLWTAAGYGGSPTQQQVTTFDCSPYTSF